MNTPMLRDALADYKKRQKKIFEVDAQMESEIQDTIPSIKGAIDNADQLFLKNNAFVVKSLRDLKELDISYQEVLSHVIEIIGDWETVMKETTQNASKYNANVQKAMIRNAGNRAVGLLYNLIKVADPIIRQQTDIIILQMNESDYLKNIVNIIVQEGLKPAMMSFYKESMITAPPEVRSWVYNYAKKELPYYTLDEKVEEEVEENELNQEYVEIPDGLQQKRGRGRPRKYSPQQQTEAPAAKEIETEPDIDTPSIDNIIDEEEDEECEQPPSSSTPS